MVAIKLDGEQVSLNLKSTLKQRISKLQETSITPGLGTILVGEDGPSKNYIAMKHSRLQRTRNALGRNKSSSDDNPTRNN